MAMIDVDFARDALVLDIDGTLIDIAPTPEQVYVPPELKRALADLSPRLGGAVAFCSGRLIAVVDKLFAPLKLAAIGCHGAELRRTPDGPVEDVGPRIPDQVKQAFADVPTLLPGVRVEDKHFTLAFHYRQAPQHEAALLALVSERLSKVGAELVELRGKAIVELKGSGFNKGTGLRALMAQPPFKGRRPIFLGDDKTDEDVLAVIAEYGGTGLSVGTLLKGASGEFASPAEVRAWIGNLAGGTTS